MTAKNKAVAVVLVARVWLCALMCFAACSENGGVKEIKKSDEYGIEVSYAINGGWYGEVEWVRWTDGYSMVTVHYGNGTEVTTAAENVMVRTYLYDVR